MSGNPSVPGLGFIALMNPAWIQSWDGWVTRAFFHRSPTGDSAEARKRLPRLTPAAPRVTAAAMPLPSAMPPAATTGTGRTASTTCGTRVRVLTVPP